MSLSEAQILYMKNVLGIDSVILPPVSMRAVQRAADPAPLPVANLGGATESARLIVLLPLRSEEFPLRGPMAELVEKMIRAMKVERLDTLLFTWIYNEAEPFPVEVSDALARAGARPVLVFGLTEAGHKSVGGEWFDLLGARAIATYSPRDLLDSNDRKRQAWVHLQSIMKVL